MVEHKIFTILVILIYKKKNGEMPLGIHDNCHQKKFPVTLARQKI